ncbi:vacuolar calcium ion transporter [Thozetella sp. PMI_491]|nr:vacuolar calcium ion transporter [Thozetella sp. PMI_491]
MTLACSPSNFLIFCIPIGVYAATQSWDPTAVFVLNFLAMFPLASILTFSTEQLSKTVGPILGGLLNASFGNALELIVGLTALRQNDIRIVQSSMVGSILSSTVLILGLAVMAAGRNVKTVEINPDISGMLTALMIISSASLLIPSAMSATNAPPKSFISPPTTIEPRPYILDLSRAASVILLLLYLIYIYFQLVSHSHLFETEPEEDDPENKIGPLSSSVILILSTVGMAVCSDYIVDSLDGFVKTIKVSRGFVGLIVVPIVGNAGELVPAVKWAATGRINLALVIVAGATLQISLFVTPFLVLLGWAMGSPMSLQFDEFETIVLTLSVLVVNCLIRNGQTNYFEGLLLVGTYLIIGIAFLVHPDVAG